MSASEIGYMRTQLTNNYKYVHMKQDELSQLTDEELLEVAEKSKPSPIIDSLFIGFFIGVIIYSVAANTWGFLTLIPLLMIYGLMKKSKEYKALKQELESRNLQ